MATHKLSGTRHKHKPKTVEELTQRNVETVARIDAAIRADRRPLDRAIDAVTAFAGSVTFVVAHAVGFTAWLLVNTLAPEGLRFDPYPFNFLTLVVSLEAIFLSTFILITQNRQMRVAELRNNLDLQINLLSEQENTKMLAMLEAIQVHLGCSTDDPELDTMEQMTRPEKLVSQIEQLMEQTPD